MIKKPQSPKLPKIRCKTEEECKQIGETLRDAYQKGRRFRKVGFTQTKEK